jgi:type IV pilus assembly protein PilV
VYITKRAKLVNKGEKSMRVNSGFSLIEVLVSMLIASIALLGLGAAQLKSLQLATNSLDYTVSLIQGQNAIERIWPNVCALQKGELFFDEPDFQDYLQPKMNLRYRYNIKLPKDYSREMPITVQWFDERLVSQNSSQNTDENQITLHPSFGNMPHCNR